MNNANGIYAVTEHAEKKNVRTGSDFVVTGLHFGAWTPDSWI